MITCFNCGKEFELTSQPLMKEVAFCPFCSEPLKNSSFDDFDENKLGAEETEVDIDEDT